ncbi:hypothetical protein [Domibacillus sp. PGB-M46]|nr:hypothetical protein [Domibacillus sp. PGB-M46]
MKNGILISLIPMALTSIAIESLADRSVQTNLVAGKLNGIVA